MGNRILKESILMSNEIDSLTWFEEVFFYRLIVTVDDRGIFPADPVVLSHILFPKKENVTKKMAEQALDTLERLDLIRRYKVPGKGAFLILASWNRHQRLRNSRPKYPQPKEAADEPKDPVKTNNVPEYGSEKSPEPAAQKDAEPAAPPDAREDAVISLPLQDGSEFGVTQREVDEYKMLYPAVDVLQELRTMRGWCIINTARRKTRSDVRRFVNSWLVRARARGGAGCRSPGTDPSYIPDPSLTMSAEGPVSYASSWFQLE